MIAARCVHTSDKWKRRLSTSSSAAGWAFGKNPFIKRKNAATWARALLTAITHAAALAV